MYRFLHLLFGTVWVYNRVPLGPNIAGIILLLYGVLYTWHIVVQSAAAAAAALCVDIRLFWLQLLLLFVIVCRIAKCWLTQSDSVQWFLSLYSNTICF